MRSRSPLRNHGTPDAARHDIAIRTVAPRPAAIVIALNVVDMDTVGGSVGKRDRLCIFAQPPRTRQDGAAYL